MAGTGGKPPLFRAFWGVPGMWHVPGLESPPLRSLLASWQGRWAREAERDGEGTGEAGGRANDPAPHRHAAPPPSPPVLSDADLYLTGLAIRLDVAVRGGATVTRCPSGALDGTLTDGSPWLLSPAVVALLAAERLLPAVVPNLPAPGAREGPAATWRELPYGAERGVAFADARAMLGACPCCAGRQWWREASEAGPRRCMACHPPPPGLTIATTET
jgi:hypothetical protein